MRDPGELVERCRGLPDSKEPHIVVVDEAQAVPGIFDAVQHLYDSAKRRWRFVLCGSSARKLRKTGANSLPGRTLLHHLYPLILPERPLPESGSLNYAVESPLPLSPVASTPESPLLNHDAAQAIDSEMAFTLEWNAFVGADAPSFIGIDIMNEAGLLLHAFRQVQRVEPARLLR